VVVVVVVVVVVIGRLGSAVAVGRPTLAAVPAQPVVRPSMGGSTGTAGGGVGTGTGTSGGRAARRGASTSAVLETRPATAATEPAVSAARGAAVRGVAVMPVAVVWVPWPCPWQVTRTSQRVARLLQPSVAMAGQRLAHPMARTAVRHRRNRRGVAAPTAVVAVPTVAAVVMMVAPRQQHGSGG